VLEGIADVDVGHVVVLADAEVEELAFGVFGEGLALGALDLLELVDLGALAVVGAADAVGEEGLEPGVGGRGRHGVLLLGLGGLRLGSRCFTTLTTPKSGSGSRNSLGNRGSKGAAEVILFRGSPQLSYASHLTP